MYLWQIRHIPNDRQTLLKLASVFLTGLVLVVSSLPATSFVAGQATESVAANPSAETKATPAEEYLQQVRQELQKHQSIKAEMNQVVSIGDQQFKIVGEYLSAGLKLKLKYVVEPKQGVQGEILEVCDGKELSTLLKVGDTTTVTQRNVQQILTAMANTKTQKVPDATINTELGLGGMTTLLASLSRTMMFDAMRSSETDGRAITEIQGRWKQEIVDQFRKEKDGSLPFYAPDLVRIYVNSQTHFPERIVYLKKQAQNSYLKTQPQKKSYRALVSLEFRNVEFDGPVDESTFAFYVPPGVIPLDVTKQYVDRISGPASATPPAGAPAATN